MKGMERRNLQIVTPEGITFSFRLAGPMMRFSAWIIDLAAISVLLGVIDGIAKNLKLFSWDIAYAVLIISYFIISIGYTIFLEWRMNGQTLGKRIMGIRVVDSRGLSLSPSQVIIRNLMRAVDMFPILYMAGGIAMLASRRMQRLGDMVGGTVVVWFSPVQMPDIVQLQTDKYNTFRRYPELGIRIRRRITPEKADIMLKAVLRRNTLDDYSRTRRFQEISGYIQSRVEFPEEALEGLSDEKIVRNTLDILYQTEG